MELGVCSCPKGTVGAACKHQAAVAKTFNIASVNIAPIHSKEACMQYAVLATGNALNEEFYAHVTNTSDEQETKSNDSAHVVRTAQLQDNIAYSAGNKGDTLTDDDATGTSDVSNPCSSWQDQVLSFKTADIVKDMVHRLEGGDHNMISGVSAFIRTYKNMIKFSPAPSAAIAYSLHKFGKADSKYHRSLLNRGACLFLNRYRKCLEYKWKER